jgi:GDSL-like Lipase/Acylhydrolase family
MPSRSRVSALVLVALLAAGCSSDAAEPDEASPEPSVSTSESSTESPTESSGQAADAAAYVALGDSYTAAPGVLVTEEESGCRRSSSNYPALVAARLDLSLLDVSCSGADTLALVGSQQTEAGPVGAQLLAITPETRLVTMGMGGNDEGLFGDLVQTCLGVRADDPTGSPCEDAMTAGGTDRARDKIAVIQTRLTSALTGIKDRAPAADVVLVGYPQLIPDQGRCDSLPLADGDYAYVREVTEALGKATRTAAADAGVLYVDTLAASRGHDVCAGPEAWVNGIANSDGRPAAPLHPFAEEQEAVADLVVAALGG